MSRKGKLPIPLPKGVEVKVSENKVFVKGPKGALEQVLDASIHVEAKEGNILVSLTDGNEDKKSFHGLYRSLIANMIEGVSAGFEKKLEMIGVGYRAAVQGNLLDVQVGLSHPTKLEIPKDIQVRVDKNIITVIGSDKQRVGQFAAEVRSLRPPSPYKGKEAKGKGVRYLGEYVPTKAGKSASKK